MNTIINTDRTVCQTNQLHHLLARAIQGKRLTLALRILEEHGFYGYKAISIIKSLQVGGVS
jgi:hypothetical protein